MNDIASIIIPHYNLGAFVEEALDSALHVDYAPVEVILVDDGSTEEESLRTVERIEKERGNDSRVRIIRKPNEGLSCARNTGIREARGAFILPLDADNRLKPTFLSKAIPILKTNLGVGVVYGWAQRFGQVENIWKFPPLDEQNMLLNNGVEACSVFRKQLWEEAGGYDEDSFQEGYEDWDFWLSILERGWAFHCIPEVLFEYRVRPGSMVTRCNQPEVRRKLVSRLIEKHHALYARHWPALLVDHEIRNLDYHHLTAAYHRYHIESLMENKRNFTADRERLEWLETRIGEISEALYALRFLISAQRFLARSLIGRTWARIRNRGR